MIKSGEQVSVILDEYFLSDKSVNFFKDELENICGIKHKILHNDEINELIKGVIYQQVSKYFILNISFNQ
jgi:hypothetical protein